MTANYGRRLSTWRKSRGLSQRQLGALVSRSQGYIGDIETGRSDPSRDLLEKLSREFGLNPAWILEGREPMELSDPQRDMLQRQLPSRSPERPDPLMDDFVAIPRLEVQLSAGPGAEGSNSVIERLAFRRDWLYRLGIDPARATIVAVRGDSMAPGLQDGDLVLVDGARTTIRPRRVYAFTDIDGQLRVKRLEPFPRSGELVIRSDNADAPLEIRHGDDAARLVIHGEVAWSAHTWRQR